MGQLTRFTCITVSILKKSKGLRYGRLKISFPPKPAAHLEITRMPLITQVENFFSIVSFGEPPQSIPFNDFNPKFFKGSFEPKGNYSRGLAQILTELTEDRRCARIDFFQN